jgi:hypothetical protein
MDYASRALGAERAAVLHGALGGTPFPDARALGGLLAASR